MIKEVPSSEKFNVLDFDEKAWHVWHSATFLMVRHNNKFRVNLYHLNGYYIQLWYNVKQNKIEKIAATDAIQVMDPYLKLIQLEDVDAI